MTKELPSQSQLLLPCMQIIDLSGLTLGTALGDGRMVLSAIMGTAHAYPQRLAAILLTNPPPGAGLLWRAVTPLLPPAVSVTAFVLGSMSCLP
jgi:hypothetical protein